MPTAFSDIYGIAHQELAEEGETVAKEYYQDVFRRLRHAIRCKWPDMRTPKNWQLHRSNADTITPID